MGEWITDEIIKEEKRLRQEFIDHPYYSGYTHNDRSDKYFIFFLLKKKIEDSKKED